MWQGHYITKQCHWSIPNKGMPYGIEEAQGNDGFTLEVLTQEAQENLTTDCHAGKPCELKSYPTAKKSHPMIE
ncbi:hypothetical protein Tco_1025308 [Tanacetum coccineum]